MDTMFVNEEETHSVRGNKCAQIFVTDFGFVWAIPQRLEKTLSMCSRNSLEMLVSL